MPLQDFDIIIIGGGLVGAGLALALRSSSLRIALVDARLPSAEDPRLFAMNYSSCQFLKNVGLWDALSKHAAPINSVHVSTKGRFGSVRLNRQEAAIDYLGHVIPARYIEAALNDSLESISKQQSNFVIFRPAKLEFIKQDTNHAEVTLSINQQSLRLTASVIIGADGTVSTVRDQAGIGTTKVDYKQSAIVTKTTLKRSHEGIAYERFNAHGAIAMLPLPNNECATIWSGDNEYIESLASLSDDSFLNKLQQEFGYRLGRLQGIAKRHQFPLQMICAQTNHKDHVLLIGNAAHTLHPIAAQGFNLALYEVALIAEHILGKTDILSAANLAQVLKKSAAQESASTKVSHYLSDIFVERSAISTIALQAGMAGLDNLSPLKKKFIERMTGRTGRVPRLLLRDLT